MPAQVLGIGPDPLVIRETQGLAGVLRQRLLIRAVLGKLPRGHDHVVVVVDGPEAGGEEPAGGFGECQSARRVVAVGVRRVGQDPQIALVQGVFLSSRQQGRVLLIRSVLYANRSKDASSGSK